MVEMLDVFGFDQGIKNGFLKRYQELFGVISGVKKKGKYERKVQ
jgi:hypothetical protein